MNEVRLIKYNCFGQTFPLSINGVLFGSLVAPFKIQVYFLTLIFRRKHGTKMFLMAKGEILKGAHNFMKI